MLWMVEEGIRGGICHSIHRYAKANNKYMENYDENKESSYIQYLDVNNLYGWAMSQKLPKNNFKWVEDTSRMNEEFVKNYNENSNKPFLPRRMKIDKCKKLFCNLQNKKKYVVHIKSLKQALNHGLKLKKIHKIIEFNQKA